MYYDTPKKFFDAILLHLSLLKTLELEYNSKKRGSIYYKRLSFLTNKLNLLKNQLDNLGKQNIRIYKGKLSNNKLFEFTFDNSVNESEVIQYIEYLTKDKVIYYQCNKIIQVGELKVF